MRSHNYNNNSMAASPSPATSHGGFRRWNSPVPYLFGGVALMLSLITVALVILAFTSRKSSSSNSSSSSSSQRPNSSASAAHEVDHEKHPRQLDLLVADSDRPEIVVIMAGDDRPTYLANPVVCSIVDCHNEEAV